MAVDASPGAGRVLIASSGGPLTAEPSWTRYDNLSACRCYGFDWNRGRQDEFDVSNTGNARVFFHDRNGTFATSTSWVGKQIMLQLWHPIDSTWEPVFRGHIDDVPSEPHSGAPELANRELVAVGIFDYLAGAKFVVGGTSAAPTMGDVIPTTSKLTGAVFYEDGPADGRAEDILDDFGLDPSMYVVFSMNVDVNETLYGSDDDALSALRDVSDAEFPSGVANAYEDRWGRVAVHGRLARFDPDATAVGAEWTFTRWAAATREDVTTGRAQIREFAVSAPRTRVINSYLAWPRQDELGFEFKQKLVQSLSRVDTTSRDAYGYRGIEESALIIKEHKTNGNTGADECIDFATYYLANDNVPRKNVDRCTFRSIAPSDARAADVWDLMCRADISDYIHLFVDEEGFSDTEFVIEGMTGSCRVLNPEYDDVTFTPNLSPAAYVGTTTMFED
jgi:hypothetical protein